MADVQYKVSTWGPWYNYCGPHLPVKKDTVVKVKCASGGELANLVAGSFNWDKNTEIRVTDYCIRTGEVYP